MEIISLILSFCTLYFLVGIFMSKKLLFFISNKEKRKWYFSLLLMVICSIVGVATTPNINSKMQENTSNKEVKDSIYTNVTDSVENGWVTTEDIDEMNDSKSVWKTITSTNTESYDALHDNVYSKIIVRKMKKYGTDVMVCVNDAQIHGSEYYDENYVMVRFDNSTAVKYTYNTPSDGSTDVIFINKATDFIKRLKTAKKIKLEVPLFQEGREIFNFETSEPLQW